MCKKGELDAVDSDGMMTEVCNLLVEHMQSDRKRVVMAPIDRSGIRSNRATEGHRSPLGPTCRRFS